MTHIEGGYEAGGYEAELDSHRRAAEQAIRAGQRADQARREARDAQRSAADSLERSANSQERTAKAYEDAAENSDRRDEYLAAAARHRQFAQEDHRMAQQLRHMGEKNTAGS